MSAEVGNWGNKYEPVCQLSQPEVFTILQTGSSIPKRYLSE